MQTNITEYKNTIGTVIAAKIASYIENHNFTQILFALVELITGIFIGAVILEPNIAANGFAWMVTTRNFAIPKMLLFVTAFFYRKNIFRFAKKTFRFLRNFHKPNIDEKLIDNIPVSELTDYLIRNRHFKREGINGVRATFGLNMEKFNQLAIKLEEAGVLERGENNGRFLSDRWSRQSLIDFLSQTEDSQKILPLLRIHQIGSNAKVRLDRKEISIR